MTAPTTTEPDAAVIEPGEGGYPESPQPCQYGSESAVKSLLFRDEDAYVPTCADHEDEARAALTEAGETVVGEVDIEQDTETPNDVEPVVAAAVEPAVIEVGPETDGEMALNFPVLVIEAVETSDGRFLNAGSLTHRALPLSLLACPESAHGGNDPDAAVVVGRIDTLTRTPGPDVVSKRTGEPFPEGSFVWSATGAMYSDVTVGKHNIGDLVRRRFLRGVSVDLAGMDVELIGEDEALADADHPRRRMVAHAAEISAATLVPIPAFGDAYVEIAGEDLAPAPVMLDEIPEGLAASAFPAWRSAEVGDYPALVAAGEEHTGGMIALVPANPDELTVEGGEPAEEIHLTLAYLGEDVTGWGPDERAAVLDHVRGWAADTAPIEADVMGWALFNPTGANDREPCAVHLVSGDGLPDAKGAMRDHDASEHPVFLPHVTAGYGVPLDALSFIGPVVFDRVRVALGMDVVDFDLGKSAEQAPTEEEAPVVAAAAELIEPEGMDEPDAPDEVGMPDAPQSCEFGDHPAVMSLMFDEDTKYLPTCAYDEQQGRDLIEQNGATVGRVVEIVQPDTDNAEEIPA
jgi:hypothetical protein